MQVFGEKEIMHRDKAIDILKGIGILAVIIGHCSSGILRSGMFSFHMPLFFLVSGYLWKQRRNIEEISRNGRRLLVPVIFTSTLALMLSLIWSPFDIESIPSPKNCLEALLFCSTGSVNPDKIWGGFAGTGKVWFLAALFWSKSIYNVLSWHLKKHFLFLVCLVVSILSVYATNFVNLPWCFLQGMNCLVFVSIGAIVRSIEMSSLYDSKLKKFIWVMLILIWILFVPYNKLNIYHFMWNEIVIVNIVAACIGTMSCYYFAKWISNRNEFLSSRISLIGRYSLVILCVLSIKDMTPFEDVVSIDGSIGLCVKLLWKLVISIVLCIVFIKCRLTRWVFMLK